MSRIVAAGLERIPRLVSSRLFLLLGHGQIVNPRAAAPQRENYSLYSHQVFGVSHTVTLASCARCDFSFGLRIW